MNRRIILTSSPRSVFSVDPMATVVVPNNHVARQLKVPGTNLEDLARTVLMSRGLQTCSGLTLQRTMSAAISRDPSWPAYDPDGTARALTHSINLLFRSGADLKQVEKFGDARIARLARVALDVRQTLLESDLVPASDLVRLAAEIGPMDRQLYIYGYPRLSRTEYDFIDKIAGDGSVLILPCVDGAPLFEDNRMAAQELATRGWSVTAPAPIDVAKEAVGESILHSFLFEQTPEEGFYAHSYPSADDEVRAVLGSIKAAITDKVYSPRDVVIVLRNEKLYGPILEEIAWEYQLPIETHYGISLQETRFGSWLLLLLEAMEDAKHPFEATSWLVNHALSLRLIDDSFVESGWTEARRIHARGDEWAGFGVRTEDMTWPETATRAQWAEQLTQTLNTLNVLYLVRERAQDVEARAALVTSLSDLMSPADEVLDRSAFITEMRDLITLTEIAASDASGGIAVHTPLALFGTRYPHVYVLGMIEEVLPGAIRDDPYLDFSARKELAERKVASLESAAEAARREEISFAMLLLTPQKSLHLSTPRQISGSPAIPSPFLERFKLEIKFPSGISGTPYRIDLVTREHSPYREIAASVSEALVYDIAHPAEDDGIGVYASRALQIVEGRESGLRDEYSGLIAEPFDVDKHTFSPSELTVFGQCTYRWHAIKLLGLGEAEEAEDDLSGRIKGTLFHETLARATAKSMVALDIRESVLENLDDALTAAIDKLPVVSRIAGWSARRSELSQVLKSAVEAGPFLMAGGRIKATEIKFRGVWEGLKVRGQIDRLDDINGQLYVVDYKTSGTPQSVKDEQGELKTDVQLSLYILLGHGALGGDSPVAGGYYYALNDGKTVHPIGVPGVKSQELDEDGLRHLAVSVKTATSAGDYPVNPDSEQESCKYCAFDPLCRRGSYLARLGVEAA